MYSDSLQKTAKQKPSSPREGGKSDFQSYDTIIFNGTK